MEGQEAEELIECMNCILDAPEGFRTPYSSNSSTDTSMTFESIEDDDASFDLRLQGVLLNIDQETNDLATTTDALIVIQENDIMLHDQQETANDCLVPNEIGSSQLIAGALNRLHAKDRPESLTKSGSDGLCARQLDLDTGAALRPEGRGDSPNRDRDKDRPEVDSEGGGGGSGRVDESGVYDSSEEAQSFGGRYNEHSSDSDDKWLEGERRDLTEGEYNLRYIIGLLKFSSDQQWLESSKKQLVTVTLIK